MTVWAVHEVKDDISPALRFGQIRYVNHRYVNGDELEQTPLAPDTSFDLILPAAFSRNLREVASSFYPVEDYLLIAGDHLQLLALTAMLAERHGSFSVLRYDRRIGEYIPVLLHSSLPGAAGRASVVPDIGHASNHIGTENGQDRDKDVREIQRLRAYIQELEAGPCGDSPHKRTP